jgi:hypothetical protein
MKMNKRSSSLLLLVFIFIVFTGCTNSLPSTASPQPSNSIAPQATLQADAAKPPSFEIEGLKNGDVVTPGNVQLQIILSNFTLVDFKMNSEPQPGQGHIHYWLDSNPTDPNAAVQVSQDPTHVVLKNVKAGEHILTVTLVGTDHKPLSNAPTEIITFLAKRQSSGAGSNSPSSPSPSPTPKTKSSTTINSNEATTKNASFQISGLKNGDIVTSADLKFKIKLNDLQLVNFNKETVPVAGEGHIHIWVDTTSTEPKAALMVYNDPDHIVIKRLKDGEHTIIVGLVSNDHTAIIGPRQSIKFTVKHSK